MNYKWIGVICIIVGCGGFGFSIGASQLLEEKTLRQLISALDYMECELQYRLTPLPELCRQSGGASRGCIREVLLKLAEELEMQLSPDVDYCMRGVLAQMQSIPKHTMESFLLLGESLGRFDLAGQLKGLEAVRSVCRRHLERLTTNKEPRIRSYQTLGLCAGAALAILFI